MISNISPQVKADEKTRMFLDAYAAQRMKTDVRRVINLDHRWSAGDVSVESPAARLVPHCQLYAPCDVRSGSQQMSPAAFLALFESC